MRPAACRDILLLEWNIVHLASIYIRPPDPRVAGNVLCRC